MIKVVNHTMLALDFHANCICVVCEECGHRGIVHKLMLQGHRRTTNGSCTPLRNYTFRCSNCNKANVSLYLAPGDGWRRWVEHGFLRPGEQPREQAKGKLPDWPHLRYKEPE